MATKKKPTVAKTIYQAIKTVRLSPFATPEQSVKKIALAVQRYTAKTRKTKQQINRELGVLKRELKKSRPELVKPEIFKERAIEGVGIRVKKAAAKREYRRVNKVRINTIRRGRYWYKKELERATQIIESSDIFIPYKERMKEGGGWEQGELNKSLGRTRVGTGRRMRYDIKTINEYIKTQKLRSEKRKGLDRVGLIKADLKDYVYYILKFEPEAIANSENEKWNEFYNKYHTGPGKYDVDLSQASAVELWDILTEDAKAGAARFMKYKSVQSLEDDILSSVIKW